jgi:hypothetical protein
MRRRPVLIVAVAIVAMASAGAVLASHATLGSADKATARSTLGPPGLEGFSVFANTGTAVEPDATVEPIAADLGATAADQQSVHVLANDLGTFRSRLVAFPAMSGRNVCYSLLGSASTDPGMSYCYRPGDIHAPPGLAGERFSVVAPESRRGENHDVATQVVGVAEDSVASLRVLVSGAWRDLPISNNGFYLDLPGVPRSDVGTVEATLTDGSKQLHDLRTGE